MTDRDSSRTEGEIYVGCKSVSLYFCSGECDPATAFTEDSTYDFECPSVYVGTLASLCE